MALTEEEKADRKVRREAEHQTKLREWAEREAEKAPPLSDQQRARLAVVLRPMREALTELAKTRKRKK